MIGRLERDLNESSRDLENLKQNAAEDVSADGETFLNNHNNNNNNDDNNNTSNTINNTDTHLPQE